MKLFLIFFSLISVANAVTGLTPAINLWDSQLNGLIQGAGEGSASFEKNTDRALGLSLNMHFLGMNSRLQYQPFSYNSRINVDSNFQFDGRAYQTGDQLQLEMDWKQWDLEWRLSHFGWNRSDTGGFDLKLAVGLKVVQAGVKLTGTRLGGVTPTVNFDETIPIPYAGLSGNARLSKYWRFEADVKLLDLSLGSTSVKHEDWLLGLRYYTDPESEKLGSFFFGWRQQAFDLTVDKDASDESRLDLKQSGLQASYQIHF